MDKNPKFCTRCNCKINDFDLHKIVMYIVENKFTDSHYEHVECPGKFGI